MKINKVYLEDAQATVTDREVTYVRIGQTIRLEGSGFKGVKQILINGYANYFSPVLVTNNNIIVSLSRDVPMSDVPEDVNNTIQLVKGSQTYKYVVPDGIRLANPTVTNISHTMPAVGDRIRLTGTALQGVTSVKFPGDVVVTEGITSDDEEGLWCEVNMPESVSADGGALFVTGINGSAYSPSYFNCKKNVFQNFDDINNYAWAADMTGADVPLTDVIPAESSPKSQGGYQGFNSAAGTINANTSQKYWTNSDAWMSAIGALIPASTAASDCGVQMDIYVKNTWNSGIIRMVMADGSGDTRYCMEYRPWYVNNTIVPVENASGWVTITLPFSMSADYEGKTFGDVLASMQAAGYHQVGPHFVNNGIADVFEPVATNVIVYFDNLRVVPLTTPAYDEFGDETTAEE
jgi:hypothetical protein